MGSLLQYPWHIFVYWLITILLFLKYHVSTIYYMEWSTILSHFLIYSCKKTCVTLRRNIIFIFIETITTNFNIFYGIIANQGANTMITPKTTIICLPNDTIFGAFHAKKKLASLSIMSAVTYRTTPNDHRRGRHASFRGQYFTFCGRRHDRRGRHATFVGRHFTFWGGILPPEGSMITEVGGMSPSKGVFFTF